MRVLGVDPGTLATGWGLVVRRGRELQHLDHGVVRTRAADPLQDRLKTIHDALADALAAHAPDALALEECYVSKNAQSALKLGHTRGVVMVAGLAAGATIHAYQPSRIKSAVTGNGRAAKHQIQEMVRVMLGLSGVAPRDASDALAAAICHAQAAGTRRPVEARR